MANDEGLSSNRHPFFHLLVLLAVLLFRGLLFCLRYAWLLLTAISQLVLDFLQGPSLLPDSNRDGQGIPLHADLGSGGPYHASGVNVTGAMDKVDAASCDGCGGDPVAAARPARQRWYLVTRGTMIGIFWDWNSAAPHVIGVRNAIFRAYNSRYEAEQAYIYARDHGLLQVVETDGAGVGEPHRDI